MVKFNFSFLEETILIIGSCLNVALLNTSVFEEVALESPSMFNSMVPSEELQRKWIEGKKKVPFPWLTSTVHVQFREFEYSSGYPGDKMIPLGPLISPPHDAE